MPLTTLKKVANYEVIESTKQLIDYINEINHFQKNTINNLYLNSPQNLEFIVSEIMVFYYILCFSLSKNNQEKFLSPFIDLLSSNPIYSQVFNIFSEIIKIEEINPYLNEEQILNKNKTILEIKQKIL